MLIDECFCCQKLNKTVIPILQTASGDSFLTNWGRWGHIFS